MSKFKVEFTLKQHTPIIHFQSDQPGATLRATELKPKFDRFLKKYAFGGDTPKKYRIDESKGAFDYKIKITSSNNKTIKFEKYPPLYFGRDNKKKLIGENLSISFISFHQELLEKIEKHFEAFLANVNFGTRQSKGYGGYYILDKEFNPSLVTHDKTKVYSFHSSVENWEKDIKLFYGFLRSGINEVDFKTKSSKFYAKSLMFLYAKSLDITWDKKAIKEYFINGQKPKNYHLMKDLLGLSANEQWSFKDGGERLGWTVKKHSKQITRYKSPITFKPFQRGESVTIYFFAEQINPDFLDQFFKIGVKDQSLTIKTPKEFSIDKFLTHSFSINLSSHIEKKFHSHKKFKKLEKIFSTLKAQI